MKQPLSVRLLALALALCPLAVKAQSIYWTGTTGAWNVPANWVGGVVPSSGDAFINSGTAQLGPGVSGTAGRWLEVGNAASQTGTLNISGGSMTAGISYIGDSGGAVGIVSMTSGTWTNNSIYVGYYGRGNVSISGGYFSTAATRIGSLAGSNGSVILSGGTWNSSTWMEIGSEGTGSLLIDGGYMSVSSYVQLGKDGGSSGTATVSSGTWRTAGGVSVGVGGAGTLRLDGGVLESSPIAGGNSGTFSFNGGTLRALSSNANFVSGFASGVTINAGRAFIDSNGFAIGIPSAFTGTGGLTKVGTGTLTLTGSNVYSGSTMIQQGTLAVNSGGSINHGSAWLNVGTGAGQTGALAIGPGGSVTNHRARVGVSGTGAVTVSGSGATWTSTDQIYIGTQSTGTLDITAGGSVTVANALYVGNSPGVQGTVTVSGTGSSLSVSGANVGVFGTGVMNLTDGGVLTAGGGAGILQLAGLDGSSGTLNIGTGGLSGILNAATVTTASAVGNTGVVNFNHTDNIVFTPQIAGKTSVNKLGSGTTTFTGSNVYTGTTTISAGALQLGNGGTTGSITGNVINNSSLIFNRSNALGYNGVISGTGVVTQLGSGTTTLGGSNTYTGGTIVQTGMLTRSVAGGFVNNTPYSVNGGVLDLNNLDLTASSFSGSGGVVNLGSGTLTVDQSTTTSYAGSISGTGGLTKLGSGTLTLTGSNTYGGGTTIRNGTLAVSGAGVISHASAPMIVGDLSGDNGSLRIGGGLVSNSIGYVGSFAGTRGDVTVTSGTWLNASQLNIGGSGTGSFRLEGGLVSGSTTVLGTSTSGFGTAVVTGGTWSTATALSIGYTGSGNLLITGGLVTGASGRIAEFAQGRGSVTVSGGTWASTGAVNVGDRGTGYLLINGGVVSGSTAVVGSATTGVGTATVTSGTWLNSSLLSVGTVGTGSLQIGGGYVSAAAVTIGSNTAGNGTAVITGGTLASAGNLAVNGSGRLLVDGGYISNVNGSIGSGTTGRGSATVTSGTWSGTGLTIAGDLLVNGGYLSTQSGHLAFSAGQDGTATVSSGTWAVGNFIGVGYRGTGDLLVTGGLVSASNIQLGSEVTGSGTVRLNGGVIATGQVLENLGSGSFVFNGGTLRATASQANYMAGFEAGDVTIASGGALIDSNGFAIGISAPLSGTGGLTKLGTGTLTLTGSGSYTGGTNISGGTLAIGSGGALTGTNYVTVGTTTGENATLLLNGGLVRSGGGFQGSFIGYGGSQGTATMNSGTWEAGSFNVGYSGTGTFNLNGGLLDSVGATVANGLGSVGAVNITSGTWRNSGQMLFGYAQTGTLAMSGGLFSGGSTYLGVAVGSRGLATINSGTFQNDFLILGASGGTGVITVNGGLVSSGSSIFGNAVSSSGTLTINNGAFTNTGTLVLGSSGTGALNVAGGTVSASRIYLGSGTSGVGTINVGIGSSAGTINTALISTGSGSGVVNFNHTGTTNFAPGMAGSLTVNKLGAGTTVLTGSSSYTGATTISGGNLMVNGIQSGTGAVTVQAGAALSGVGSLAGVVTVNNGGILAPGNSPGTLTVGSMILNASSDLQFELGTTSDLVVVLSDLTLDGVLNVTSISGFGSGSYTLFQYGGSLFNNGLTLGTMPSSTFLYALDFSQAGQVRLTVAPPDLYWDGSNTTPDGLIMGGSGTWNNTLENWTTASGSSNYAWIPTGTANFTGTAGTVTVAETINVNNMVFTSSGYLLNGPGSLANSGSTLTISTGSGVAVRIDTPITGAGGLVKTGSSGLVTLGGSNSYTGHTIVKSGTLAVSDGVINHSASNMIVGDTSGDNGSLQILSGALVENMNAYIGSGTGSTGSATVNGGIWNNSGTLFVGNSGAGTLNVNDGLITSTIAHIGHDAGAQGTVTVSGGTWTNPTFRIGHGGTGTMNVSGGFVQGSGVIGNLAGSNGTVTVSGGTWNGNLVVGNSGTGTLNMNSGLITSFQSILGGNPGSLGTALVSGGTWSHVNSFQIGSRGEGILEISGGLLENTSASLGITNEGRGTAMVSGGTWNNTGATVVGGSGIGTVNVTGGLVKAAEMRLGGATEGTGSLNLSGGVLETGALVEASGTGTIVFNGGTLRATGSNADFLRDFEAGDLAINAGGAIIDDAGFTIGIQSVLSGTGGLVKNGSGLLTLTGTNTYSGGTRLNSGTLMLGNPNGPGSELGTGALTMENGTTLGIEDDRSIANGLVVNGDVTFDTVSSLLLGIGGPVNLGNSTHRVTVANGGAVTWSGTVSGNGGLTLGGGALTLTGQNTYSGPTTVNTGGHLTLYPVSGTAVAGDIVIDQGGTILVRSNESIANASDVTVNGSLILANASETIDVLSGSGGVQFEFSSLPDATLAVGSGTFAGGITESGGTGRLRKLSSGTLTLSGNNSYSGDTWVDAGKLVVNGVKSGTGATTVASGAALSGSGTIAGRVSVADGGILEPGTSPGTLTVGSLLLNSTSELNFELGTASDLVVVMNDLTLDGVLNVTSLSGFGVGSYTLFQYAPGMLTNSGLSFGTTPAGFLYSIDLSTDGLVRLVVAPPDVYWDGSNTSPGGSPSGGSGTWNNSGTNTNWTNADGTTNFPWIGQGTANFTGTSGTVAVADTINVSDIVFETDGYVLSGTGALAISGSTLAIATGPDVTTEIGTTITGTGGLLKTGTGGRVILTGTNDYTGGTTIATGTLQLGNGGTTGSIVGDVLNDGTLAFNRSDAYEFAGSISGSGNVIVDQTGVLSLTGSSSYSGGTALDNGTLLLGDDNALGTGGLTLADGTTLGVVSGGDVLLANAVTINGDVNISVENGDFLDFDGMVDLGSISRTLTFTQDGSNVCFMGDITGGAGLSLVMSGSGMSGVVQFCGDDNNTYTGLTRVGDGVELALMKDAGATAIAGDLQIDTGGLVEIFDSSEQINPASTVTVNGTLDFFAFSGTTTQTFGGLQGTGSIINTGGPSAITVNAGNFGGTIVDTGADPLRVIKSGAGLLTLSGNNDYRGGTLINAGTLRTLGTSALGNAAGGSVNVALAGGSLSPTGRLSINTLDWTGGTVASALGTITSLLDVSGNLTLTGTGVFEFTAGTGFQPNNAYAILTSANLGSFVPGNFAGNALVGLSPTFTVVGDTLYVSFNGATDGRVIQNSAPYFTPTDADFVINGQATTGGPNDNNTVRSLIFGAGSSLQVFNNLTVTSGDFMVASGSSTVTGGNVIAPGTFTKLGAGALNFLSNVSVGGAANVMGGSLYVNGIFTTGGGLTVFQNALLGGAGIINGDVVNNGIVAPGNSPGTLTINGNFVNNNTLQIEIASASIFDRLIVSGNAALGGTLQIIPFGGNRLEYGQQFAFLQAGRISGEFDRILMPNPDKFRGRFVVDGGTGTLLVAPTSYTLVAQTTNQSNVAAALDSYIPERNNDRETVSTALDFLTAEQYPAAFEQIMPGFYESLGNMTIEQSVAQSQFVAQRMSAVRLGVRGFSAVGIEAPLVHDKDGKSVLEAKDAKDGKDILTPTPDNKWGVWVQGNGIFARAYNVANVPNSHYESGGVFTGVDYRWSENFTTGVYGGYQGLYSKYSGGGLTTIHSALFGGYATYQQDGFYANAIVGGGYNGYRTRRPVKFSTVDRTAQATPNGGQFNTYLDVGYDWKVKGFTFGPILSGQYTYAGIAPFTESNAGSLNLAVDQQNINSLRMNVGGRVAYTWSLNEKITLIPEVRLFWQHEFLENPRNIGASLDGGSGPSFGYETSAPDRDSVFAGAGISAQFGDRWDASFYYNANFGRSDFFSSMISASVGFKF